MDMKIRPDIAAAPEIESIEIMELLGKGGMSVVYKARQKQLDRIVAVKVLSKMAVRGEDGLKRFQKEARFTSSLEHPNIVKTISFGVSKDGQPYLVMEYLEGLSLADELKQNGRLKLQKFKDVFLPALSALNHAHQAGLVHRDIKPGNIMLCRNETAGETVKLVDFGIAKVFGEGESQTQQLTKTGAVLGSPAYMSPEQCQGKSLDGRSDLYSMACVMYETLSGEPPFSGDSLLEVMQKHSIEPPPTVSEMSRKIDIRKELAKVTLWGLAKDPAARPQTASEFARKLNEVLQRITLDKVPRLKKTGLAAARALVVQQPLNIACIVACVILGVAVFMTNAMRNTTRKQLQATPKVASLDKQKSEEAKRERIYKEALFRAENRGGPDQPELLDPLKNLEELYKKQEKWAQAEPLAKRRVVILEKLWGPNSLDVAEAIDDQARECFCQVKKLPEAELLFKRVLAIRKKAFGAGPKVAWSLMDIADCYRLQHRFEEAESLFKRALAMDEKVLGPNHKELNAARRRFARYYIQLAQYADAEPLLKSAVANEEKVLEPNDPDLAECVKELADCYSHQGKAAEAVRLLKRALAIRQKALVPNDPEVGIILNALADCYRNHHQYAEAESFYKRAIAIRENTNPDTEPLADSLSGLAACYMNQNNHAEAEPLINRAITIREKEHQWNLVDSVNMLADCYKHQGKTAEAEQVLKRGHAIEPKTELMKSESNEQR
jgi:tetratricopeptide (TPR) repeat protein/tRNA A-37 threonylcarbamoyl transferase component Bud32